MRKLKTCILILVLVSFTVQAKTEYRIFLPTIERPESMAGYWDIAMPEQAENMALNPIFGIAGNFAAVGGGAMTRVAEYGWKGLYGGRIQAAANNEGGSVTLLALTNAIHYATVRVRGTLPTAWDWSLNDAAYTAPVLLLDYDDTWSLYGLEFPAAQANGSTTLYIRQNGAGAGDFYVDGVNVTLGDYPTSHVDGDQPGCKWNVAAHASTSTRSALSRAGGRWQNLEDDFGFHITEMIDTGMPPTTNISDTYALAAGGQVQGQKVHERSFSLMGKFIGTSLKNLNALRRALIDATKPDAVPETDDGPQPILFRYTEGTVVVKISAHYESGLEARIVGRMVCSELIPLRVFADDPYFYEFGNSAASLDTSDAATIRYIAGRLRSNGQWDDLGLTANPTAGGRVRAIAYNKVDGLFYVGGEFVGLDGVVGRNYAATYNLATNAFGNVGGAGAFSAMVRTIAIAPNGDVYFGGNFLNAGGATGDYLAYLDISTSTLTPVSGGGTGNVHGIAFDSAGNLYFVGNFINWNGIANADRVGRWTGGAYQARGTGFNGIGEKLALHPNGDMYAVGVFTTADGASAINIAKWTGGDWEGVADNSIGVGGIAPELLGIDIDKKGRVYIAGIFDIASGDTNAAYVAFTDGAYWKNMSSGANDECYVVMVMPDGSVWLGGAFTQVGDLATQGVAIWNGSSWVSVDAALPFGVSGIVAWALAFRESDPVVDSNFDVLLGSTGTAASEIAGTATVINDGTERALPLLNIERSGGTEAIIKQIRNEDTGRTISINYALLDGERLTINIVTLAVISSFFDSVPGAILAGSDFGTFDFLSGPNQITAFVDTDATVTAWVEYVDTYWSMD